MKPLCDHSGYQDGKCLNIGSNWHFSHPSHDRSHKVPVDKVAWAFFYCGRANHNRALLNTRTSHKWTTDNRERDGDTFCVRRDPEFYKKYGKFKYKNHEIERVPVSGKMISDNIYKACEAKSMKPVCDHANYFDGRCEMVGEHWHFSHQHHSVRQRKMPAESLRDAYIYCGRANHHWALQQTYNGHRWSNNNDRDGDTLCTKASKQFAGSFDWEGYLLHRVNVKGYITSQNILKACKAKGMKPLCDHSSYNDGKCLLAGSNWHFSHPSHDRSHQVPVDKVKFAFFYCGRANHNRALLNTGTSHKWTRDNYERDGDTFCAQRDPEFMKKYGKFKYKGHTVTRVKVSGEMRSSNIEKACTAKGMRPVCDHASYMDGKCTLLGGNWHMSHPHHTRSQQLGGKKFRMALIGAYMYCGRAHGGVNGWALQHTKNSHRWSNSRDKDGETLCAKADTDKFNWRTYTLHRALISGRVNSASIKSACNKKGMRPVCENWNANYNDGHCTPLGPWHMSNQAYRNGMPLNSIRSSFFYCGRAHGDRSLYNIGNSHRWTRGWEENGETWCVKSPGYTKVKSNQECKSKDTHVGTYSKLWQCANAVQQKGGKFFIWGQPGSSKQHRCYIETTSSEKCPEGWEDDKYDFYKVGGTRAEEDIDEQTQVLLQEGLEAPKKNSKQSKGKEKSESKSTTPPFTFKQSMAPLPWQRYGTSFKWLWPACPGGDCKKAKPATLAKKSDLCSAEFFYGIQGCGKFPGASVTWTNPITSKIETSEVGCNCRGENVKAVFYGSITDMKDQSAATQQACATQFNKWSVTLRTKIEGWQAKLSGLSEEMAKKCSPTYPVLQKEIKYKGERKALVLKQMDREGAIMATPRMIQDGFRWLKRPTHSNMPSNYDDNNGECSAKFIHGLSVCNSGTMTKDGSLSFGCDCNGLLLQGANYGVITSMKNQKKKTQLKCARLFAKWSAERTNVARSSYSIAYDHASVMAGKCSPAAKLAVKSSKQKGLLDRASKIKPSLETNTQSLSDLKAGHEKSHKSKTRALELAAKKQAQEKATKAQGEEKNAKMKERADKETKHKQFHKNWNAKNKAQERTNKAQVDLDHNEKMKVEDVKSRAEHMLKQINSGKIPKSAPPENRRLTIRGRKIEKKIEDLERTHTVANAKMIEAKIKMTDPNVIGR